MPMHPQAVMSRRPGPEDAASHITVRVCWLACLWSRMGVGGLLLVGVVIVVVVSIHAFVILNQSMTIPFVFFCFHY